MTFCKIVARAMNLIYKHSLIQYINSILLFMISKDELFCCTQIVMETPWMSTRAGSSENELKMGLARE